MRQVDIKFYRSETRFSRAFYFWVSLKAFQAQYISVIKIECKICKTFLINRIQLPTTKWSKSISHFYAMICFLRLSYFLFFQSDLTWNEWGRLWWDWLRRCLNQMTINIIMEKPNRMITENVKSDEIFTMRIDRYDGHQKTLSMKNAEYNQLWTPISIVASKISTLWISKISTFVIVVV